VNQKPQIALLTLITLFFVIGCVTVDDRRDVVDDVPSGQVDTVEPIPSPILLLGTGGPCTVDADCDTWIVDYPCLGALCKKKICHAFALENGWPCSDGNHLTRGDSCLAGTCRGGTDICVCADDFDCEVYDNDNPCDGRLLCDGCACVMAETPLASPCNDHNPSTWNDQCVEGGICLGQVE